MAPTPQAPQGSAQIDALEGLDVAALVAADPKAACAAVADAVTGGTDVAAAASLSPAEANALADAVDGALRDLSVALASSLEVGESVSLSGDGFAMSVSKSVRGARLRACVPASRPVLRCTLR